MCRALQHGGVSVIPEFREAKYPGPRVEHEPLAWVPARALTRSAGMTTSTHYR